MYLFELQNVFIEINKCICPNLQIYISKLQLCSHHNTRRWMVDKMYLVKIAKCICPNQKMYFVKIKECVCPNQKMYLSKLKAIFVQMATLCSTSAEFHWLTMDVLMDGWGDRAHTSDLFRQQKPISSTFPFIIKLFLPSADNWINQPTFPFTFSFSWLPNLK